jgi:hypothetical protein
VNSTDNGRHTWINRFGGPQDNRDNQSGPGECLCGCKKVKQFLWRHIHSLVEKEIAPKLIQGRFVFEPKSESKL